MSTSVPFADGPTDSDEKLDQVFDSAVFGSQLRHGRQSLALVGASCVAATDELERFAQHLLHYAEQVLLATDAFARV